MFTDHKPLDLSAYDHPDIYPGPTPSHSFVYAKDMVYSLNDHENPSRLVLDHLGKRVSLNNFLKERGATPLEERYPVLSYGSNVCLAQLKYKFNLNPKVNDVVIHLKGSIKDSDVLYAASITHYGAIPALLGPMKGNQCQVWLSLFDKKQLHHINLTEKYYSLAVHVGKKIRLDSGLFPKECYAYHYNKALSINGALYRYPDIPASQSSAHGVWQAHMLQYMSECFSMEREKFIQKVKNDVGFRRRVQRTLDLLSIPVVLEDWEPIKKIRSWREIK